MTQKIDQEGFPLDLSSCDAWTNRVVMATEAPQIPPLAKPDETALTAGVSLSVSPQPQGEQLSDAFTKQADLNFTINEAVSQQVLVAAKEYTNRVFRYLLMVVVGAIAASIWNLNGQIYQAVGATSVSTKALELEIARLNDEVKSQKSLLAQKDCLENKKVLDKAGCYRGN